MDLVGRRVRIGSTAGDATVAALLGEGGQGSVYEVRLPDGGAAALKWYHPHTATVFQRQLVAELVERGAPNGRFLWPEALVQSPELPGFGYVMPLRPKQFVGLAALLTGAVDASLRTVCTIGYQLADSFVVLHTQGLCYRDISFGNVFFDPATGDTLICDNDNVGIDGRSQTAVMGTKRFMAPEIVCGDARPSTNTDLYSLSVLLFYLLMVGHPLLGLRELDHPVWNEHAETQLFGEHPIFVFDPDDTSNRPAPGVHDTVVANWEIYPLSLRQMFVRAFTDGLGDPANGRVRDSQWRGELIRCRDLLRPCRRCAAMNFFDRTRPMSTCWNCATELGPPLRLIFPDATLVLNEGTEVSAHHLGLRSYDFEHTVARVSRHPQRPDAWGLTNTADVGWKVRMPTGDVRVVEPGRSVGLIPGMSVSFGTATAKLEAQG